MHALWGATKNSTGIQETPAETVIFIVQPLAEDLQSDAGSCYSNVYTLACLSLGASLIPSPGGRAAREALEQVDDIVDRASTGARRAADTCDSFIPGTQVLMADGTVKAIEAVEIGDEVFATDPETGEAGSETVTAQIRRTGSKQLVTLTVDGSNDRPANLTATDSHPFWGADREQWLDAADLEPGMALQTPEGDELTITAIQYTTARTTVHNLTVEDLHTYYVLAGETPVLVHNSNCNLFDGDGWQHVLDEHVDGSPGVTQGNTTFSNYMDLDEIGELIEDASNTPGRRNTPDAAGRPRDGTIHTHDFGYPVGSRGETSVEVILNPDGSLRTAYPR